MEQGKKYRLVINGKEHITYDTQVFFDNLDGARMVYNPYISNFACADARKEADVCLKPLFVDCIDDVKIQPSSLNISFSVKNGAVLFKMPVGQNVIVTINGLINEAFMLFLNTPIEYHKDDNTIYFPKGVHIIDDDPMNRIYIKSNERLFIDAGAVVYGRVYAENAENIKIEGNGILCGSKNNGRWVDYLRPIIGIKDTTPRGNLFVLKNCRNVEINGITLVDSDGWTLHLHMCGDVRLNGVKIIGYQSNSDGIDIVSCKNVELDNCFVRTSDDCIVVKACKDRNTENIRIKNSAVYADKANGLEIGHEFCGSDIFDVKFENIDIINCQESTYGYHAIDITNVDLGRAYNISFENIRVENCQRLIGVRMREGVFSNAEKCGKGEVFDIHFKNIYSDNKRAVFLSGRDSKHLVHDISFENIFMCGKKLESLDSVYNNNFIENITLWENGEIISRLKREEYDYLPIDIRKMCNLTVGTHLGIYNIDNEDWMTMPGGVNEWEGVPFNITTQGYNPDGDGEFKRVVVPQNRINYPCLPIAEINQRADTVFFMHTTVNVYSEIDLIVARYEVEYEDGNVSTIPVRNQNDSHDIFTWSTAGWQPVWGKLKFYIMKWDNPYPEKIIKSITFTDGDTHELQILLGITLGKKKLM